MDEEQTGSLIPPAAEEEATILDDYKEKVSKRGKGFSPQGNFSALLTLN